jgi:DNA-binding Lrp family transcriptional regulator
MDENDLKIILLLIINSRLSYREIAEYLGLSVNAVYKRVQQLIDLDIIQKFTAKLKPYSVNAIYTFFFGKSESQDITQISEILGNHENTFNIILSSRNFLYIGALLRTIHELNEYTSFVAQTAKMQSPQLGILHGIFYESPVRYSIPRKQAKQLDKLDRAIVRALHHDSRKPIAEVADEVSSTANTVRRRLSRMLEEGLIDCTIDFNPVSSNDIFILLQITLNPGENKDLIAQRLIDEHSPHIFYCWTFSNLPNFVLAYTWCNTMNELNELVESLKQLNVESVVPDVLFKGLFYDTWKENLLYE